MLPEYKYFLGQLKRSLPELWANLQEPAFDGWLLIRWTCQALLITLLILAADYLAGAGAISALRIRVAGRLRLVAALSTGIALQGLLVFGLGLSGHLTARAVRAGGIALGLAGLVSLWRHHALHAYLVRAWLALRPRRWWPVALASPLLLVYAADLMQPVAEGDSTMYHMAAARHYRDHHALPYHSEIRFNAQPHLTVLLYLRHWLVTGEDTLLKLFNLELLLLLVAALIAGLKELKLRARWLPLLAMASSPVFVWTAKVEYADLALAAFVTAGGVLLVASLRRRSVALAALGGLALATAGASKLQGLVLAAILLAAFLDVAWRAGWPARRWAAAGALASSAIVIWDAGWWIRSWLATGSPAYPFFSSTPELGRLMAVNQTYGFGHGVVAMLLLPLRAVSEQPVHFADAYTFGPALLLGVASGALLAWQRRFSHAIQFLGWTLGLFFVFWFFSGQVMRYWASTLGLQALWIAAGLTQVLRRRMFSQLTAFGLGVCSVIHLAITSPTLLKGWPPPVTFAQKETAQAESLRYYRAARVLNQLAAPGDRIYAWYCEDAKFHLTRGHAGDWFGENSYFWLSHGAASEQEVVARLREAGYRYVLLDRDRGKLRAEMFMFAFMEGEFLRVWGTPPGTRRVYDDGQYAAFLILPGIK